MGRPRGDLLPRPAESAGIYAKRDLIAFSRRRDIPISEAVAITDLIRRRDCPGCDMRYVIPTDEKTGQRFYSMASEQHELFCPLSR